MSEMQLVREGGGKEMTNRIFNDKNPRFYLRCVDCDKLLGAIMDSNIKVGWILCNKCLKIRIRKDEVTETNFPTEEKMLCKKHGHCVGHKNQEVVLIGDAEMILKEQRGTGE
jgi:hypothetical protein